MGRGKRTAGTSGATSMAPSGAPAAAGQRYRLLGPAGHYLADAPGTLGGHRGNKVYGRLDCPSALQWLAAGYYAAQRVFFADERTALASGYRPCGCCLPGKYAAWKRGEDPALAEGGQMRRPLPIPTRFLKA